MSTITSTETHTADAVFASFTPTVRKYDFRRQEGKFFKSLQSAGFVVETGEVISFQQDHVNGEWLDDQPVAYKALKVTTITDEKPEDIVADLYEFLTEYEPTRKVTDDDFQTVVVPNVVRWVTERIFLEDRVDGRYPRWNGWKYFKVTTASLDEAGNLVITEDIVDDEHEFAVNPVQRKYDRKTAEYLPTEYKVGKYLAEKREAKAKADRVETLIAGAKASFVPSGNYERLQRNAERVVAKEVDTEHKRDWRSYTAIAVDHEVKALCAEFLRVLGKTDWEVDYPRPIDSSGSWRRNEEGAVPTVIDEVHAYAIVVTGYTARYRSTNDDTISIIGLVLREFNEVLRNW